MFRHAALNFARPPAPSAPIAHGRGASSQRHRADQAVQLLRDQRLPLDSGVYAVIAADQVRDPVWRMPFWDPYEPLLEPGIADLDNAPKGGMAGSVTAALFLRRFVTDTPRYLHFDIYGWQPVAAPARPKGGVGQGTRAILAALPNCWKFRWTGV